MIDPLPAMRTRFAYDNLTNATYAIMEPDPLGTQLRQDDKVDVAVEKVRRDEEHIDRLVADLDRPSLWRRFVDWLANRHRCHKCGRELSIRCIHFNPDGWTEYFCPLCDPPGPDYFT